MLRAEAVESGPKALIAIRDVAGNNVRWVEGPARAGTHRVSWDLRFPSPDPIDLVVPEFVPPWAGPPKGPLTAPGTYEAQLVLITADGATPVGDAQSFEVRPVPTAEAGTDFAVVGAFQQRTGELSRRISSAGEELGRAQNRLRHMRAALLQAPNAPLDMFTELDRLGAELQGLQVRLFGDRARQQLNESTVPSISNRVGRVAGGHWDTRAMPTTTHQRNLEIAESDFGVWRTDFGVLMDGDFATAERDLEAAGAPWTPGRQLPG